MLGISFRRWNWVDDGLLPLAAVVMSASWGYPLFDLFLRSPRTGAHNPGFTFWLCLAVLAAGLVVGRLASENRMGPVIVIVGGLAAIVALLMLVVPTSGQAIDVWFIDLFHFVERGRATGEILPAPLVVIVFGTLFWARGVRLASLEHEGAVGSFIVGIVATSGLLLVSELLPSTQGVAAPANAPFFQNAVGSLVPLFLITVPAAILLSVLAPALGQWASTAGEVALVVGLVFLSMIMPFGPDPQHAMGWLLLFLGSGLAVLGLISVSSTLREQERLTGLRLRIDRYWVLIMFVAVAVVLVLGLLVGQIVAPGAVLRLLGLLRPVWVFVRQILLFIIMIFAYLFFSLLEPLLGELDQRALTQPNTLQSPVQPESMEDFVREAAELPPAFTVILQIILILGALGVIALLFYMAMRRREKRTANLDDVVETRETVLSLDLLQEQFRGLLDGLRRRRHALFVDLESGEERRRIVRALYRHLLGYAIRLSAPRLKFQTPNSYRRTLVGLCPQESAAVDALTEVYVVARYGIDPPTVEQVEVAQKAYARIETAVQATYELGGWRSSGGS